LLAALLLGAPLAAQQAQPDTARARRGFEGPAGTRATMVADSEDKDPFWRWPINLFDPWQAKKREVQEATGLTYGLQYQAMYARASESLDDNERSSASGIFVASASWDLFGAESGNVGRLVTRVDSRHVYGSYTTSPQLLAFQTGSMAPTAVLFADAPFRLMTLYWAQGLFGGRAGIIAGKIFPDDWLNHHQLMNPLTDFLGLGSVFAPVMSLPNPGIGIGAGTWIGNNMQLKVVVADPKGDPYNDDFWEFGGEQFFDGEFFKSAEVLWLPDPDNPYGKRVSVTAWHADEYDGPDGSIASTVSHGVTLASNWTIGRWVPLFLAGVSNGGGANAVADAFVTGGMGYRLRSQDVTGVTLSWLSPPADGLRSQTTLEGYFRFYISDAIALTPNLQWVFNPSLNEDVGSMTYFQIRARLAL
jgi:porin